MKPTLALLILASFLTLARADVNPLNGLWVAANPNDELTRLSVTRQYGDALIEAWGNLQPPDHDWGQSLLTCYSTLTNGAVADRALASWDNPSAHTVLILKLSPDGEHLTVETFTNIKNNPTRRNYATEVEMVRQKS